MTLFMRRAITLLLSNKQDFDEGAGAERVFSLSIVRLSGSVPWRAVQSLESLLLLNGTQFRALLRAVTRESSTMALMGYETNASCKLKWWGKSGWSHAEGTVVKIATDGAEVLCRESLASGSALTVLLEGYSVGEREAQVRTCGSNSGAGYRMQIRLTDGSWPYEVFSTLMTIGATPTSTPQTSTPPCLVALGLQLPCTVEDVENAFEELVRKAHPDRGGDVDAFTKLRAAYIQAINFLEE